MATEQILSVEDLSVVYRTDDAVVHAINGVNLTVNRGETIGLVGETGAGKTTLALSIMKLLPERIGFVERGSIVLDDKEILKCTPADMRLLRGETVSMIFQDPMTSLNPIHTIGDQIAEVLILHGDQTKAKVHERVDEILNMVGLPPSRKHEYPHQFSGGMKQRVVIAMALACEPQLLLADEPTTALDVTIQAQVLQMMKGLKEKLNTAMILITHDLGVVAQTCDRVAIMYAGEIVEIGTVHDIFEGEVHHPYTMGLFNSIPDMKVESSRLHAIDGLMPDPSNLPVGCKFHPRCAFCSERCQTESPTDHQRGSHMVKCHLMDDTEKQEAL